MKISRFRLIQIIASAIIVVVIANNLNFAEFGFVKIKLNFFHLSSILFFLLATLLFRAYRWQFLMNRRKGYKMNFIDSFKLYLVGMSLNLVTPAGAGSVAKSYFGYKWTGDKERMFAVSLYDKFLGLAGASCLAFFSLFFLKEWLFILVILFGLSPLLFIVFIVFLRRIVLFNRFILYLNNKIKRIDIEEVIHHLKFDFKSIFFSLILSIIGWVFTYVILYIIFNMLHADISIFKVIAFGPVLTLVKLFPFTLNGVGSDEATFLFLFSSQNLHNELILTAAILFRIVITILPAIGGIAVTFFTRKLSINS